MTKDNNHTADMTRSRGNLVPHEKTKEKSPDMTGPIMIHRKLIIDLLNRLQNNPDSDVIHCNGAMWFKRKKENGTRFVTVEISPYYPKKPKPEINPSIEQFFKAVETGSDDEDDNKNKTE